MTTSVPPTRSLPASALKPDEMYLLLRDSVMPRPIAWVSTVDPDGVANLAPYSFFNVCSNDPPVIGFSVMYKSRDGRGRRRTKDTLENIRATGEMVVNIVPESLMLPMVATSAELPVDESEFEFAKLDPAPSTTVRPARVAGAPVAFECTTFSILELGASCWVMGRVVHVHVDERVYLGELKGVAHRIDLMRHEAMRPVGRLGRANYVRLREIDTVLRQDGNND